VSVDIVALITRKQRLLGENRIAGKITRLFPMSRQIDVAEAIAYATQRYRQGLNHTRSPDSAIDNAVADAVLLMASLEANETLQPAAS